MGYIWDKLTTNDRDEVLRLLRSGQKITAIKYLCKSSDLCLKESKRFIETEFVLRQVVKADPTRMSPKDEFRAKVLRVVTDMLVLVNEPDTTIVYKYDILSKMDIPKLFDLCMEK